MAGTNRTAPISRQIMLETDTNWPNISLSGKTSHSKSWFIHFNTRICGTEADEHDYYSQDSYSINNRPEIVFGKWPEMINSWLQAESLNTRALHRKVTAPQACKAKGKQSTTTTTTFTSILAHLVATEHTMDQLHENNTWKHKTRFFTIGWAT